MGSPNYTANVPLMSDNNFRSNPDFTYSLLSGVYDVANRNLREIFPSFQDVVGCRINPDDLLDFSYCDGTTAEEIIDDFQGVFSYLVAWALFGIIFTVVGIIWCLCNKCCCCCGIRKKDKFKDLVNTDPEFEVSGLINSGKNGSDGGNLYLRIFVGILMALWILGMAFSVFTAFASNESLRRSIFEFHDDVDKPLHDTEMYLNTTKEQINAVFVTSYGNLSRRIEESAGGINEINMRHGTFVQVQKLTETSDKFISTFEAHQNSVDETLRMQVPEISHHLQTLKSALENEVTPLLNKIGEYERQLAGNVEEAIRITGEDLQRHSQDLISALNEIPIKSIREDIQDADEDVLDIVGPAVYGTFMTFNVVILALLAGIIMGFVVSWIGKGSSKKTGFIFYRFTIATMFTIGWLVTIAMVSGFFGAGFFSQIACGTVRDLENTNSSGSVPLTSTPSLINIFQATTTPSTTPEYDTPSYGNVVSACKASASAYNALQLGQVYDIETIYTISDNFEHLMNSLVEPTNNFFTKNVHSVYSRLNNELIALQTSHLSWSNSDPTTESEVQIEKLKSMLAQIESQLISLAEKIKELESGDVIRSSMRQGSPAEIITLVNEYEEFVHRQVKDNIGQCQPLYVALNATVHIFCYKFLAPVATYWWALQLLLIMFVTVIITALVEERLVK